MLESLILPGFLEAALIWRRERERERERERDPQAPGRLAVGLDTGGRDEQAADLEREYDGL